MRGNPCFQNPTTAIAGSSGVDIVVNNGAINGDVLRGDGADQLLSTMGISGLVDGGAGDDLICFTGLQSFQSTIIEGGAGDDRLELVNSGLASSAITTHNVETLVLDGVLASGNSGDLRITSLCSLSGVRSLQVIGDLAPADAFANGPQFYIHESVIPEAAVQLSGRAALYLDRSIVASIVGDNTSNNLSIWGTARVLNSIDMGGGDDFISVGLVPGSNQQIPSILRGGTGNDWLSINLDVGGVATLDLGTITGFETVLLGINGILPGSMTVSNLAGASPLDFFGPVEATLRATVAPTMTLDLGFRSLIIASDTIVGAIGWEFGFGGSVNPNPPAIDHDHE
jgi:hypothetical protein